MPGLGVRRDDGMVGVFIDYLLWLGFWFDKGEAARGLYGPLDDCMD